MQNFLGKLEKGNASYKDFIDAAREPLEKCNDTYSSVIISLSELTVELIEINDNLFKMHRIVASTCIELMTDLMDPIKTRINEVTVAPGNYTNELSKITSKENEFVYKHDEINKIIDEATASIESDNYLESKECNYESSNCETIDKLISLIRSPLELHKRMYENKTKILHDFLNTAVNRVNELKGIHEEVMSNYESIIISLKALYKTVIDKDAFSELKDKINNFSKRIYDKKDEIHELIKNYEEKIKETLKQS